MIFNVNESVINENVMPSPYEVGLEGALMHIYENECNYNALMKAAGLSELKYYQETGKDLFIHEAGAFSGFLVKARDFFKKVIEKIKAMFKKFFMIINKFIVSDKDFVKKYEKELLRVDTTGLEFTGYKFDKLDNSDNFFNSTPVKDIANMISSVKEINADKDEYGSNTRITLKSATGSLETEDELNDQQEKLRAQIAKGSGQMTESEFREELKEKIFGDKEDMENISLREQLSTISNSAKNIKEAEKAQKKITDDINALVRELDKKTKAFGKTVDSERSNSAVSQGRENTIKHLNGLISLAKSGSNDVTAAYGIYLQALKERNKQAKAICIKAINYKPKNESYSYSENGLFSDVVIR